MSLVKKLSLSLFSILILLSIPNLSVSAEKIIIGKAQVIDGDTIKIDGTSIRLFGIDAPEKNQLCVKKNDTYNCGSISTKALKKYVGREKIKCSYTEKDRYDRILGICYFPYDSSKLSLNRYMVHSGHAVAYKRYSKRYLLDEQYAKENKLGIWGGTFTEPEKWRRIMN